VVRRKFDRLICGVATLVCASVGPARTQDAPSAASRVVIASLANDTNPLDLDFQGGECEIGSSGRTMDCEFQQVFLTISPLEAQTCLVTTNRYARTFEKTAEHVWVSREGPTGPCGMLDVSTLTDEGGGRRWMLEQRQTMTRKDSASCSGPDPKPEVLTWRSVRRPLPCRFVRPGALR
jgi:hypothetical protein